MVGYPKREKGTRRNHCIFWGKGEESVLIGAGMGQGGSPQSFRQTTSGAHVSTACADCLPRGEPTVSNSMCRLGRKEAHRRGLTRRLRRGVGVAVSWGSRQLRCPKVSKGRAESPLLRPQTQPPFPDEGLTRRLRRGWRGCRPEGGSTFFRAERKYQRKHAARRLLRSAPLCVIRKYRRSGHCRARPLYLLRPVSR